MKFPRVEISAKSYTGDVLEMLIKFSVAMVPLGIWKMCDILGLIWKAIGGP